MAKINLLPWREELRQQKKQDFFTTIGLSVLVTILIIGLVHLYIEGLKDYQKQRNKLLQDEIVLLDKKIIEINEIEAKKAKLLAKIDLIQKLQESRPEIVHLFDEIPRVTPEGVFLTKFTQAGAALTFNGKSQANARVSAFMRAIDASSWLQASRLDVIQSPGKTNSEQLSDFILYARQGKQQPEAKNGGN